MFNISLHPYIVLWITTSIVCRTLAGICILTTVIKTKIYFNYFHQVVKQKGEICAIPNGSDGRCVPSENCQILSNKVKYSGCGDNLICCENPGPIDGNYLKANVLSDYATCGIVKEQTRIWGGGIAEIGEFPWIAAIEFKNRYDDSSAGVRCSGSLINDEFVLTGAVCVINREFQAYVI